ncbi:hypothetical protein K9L27_00735 [Candidatus Gracilibacteria bacterium]|nr:hypothetical protein [Candidatus Gracilibacteria bacterium]
MKIGIYSNRLAHSKTLRRVETELSFLQKMEGGDGGNIYALVALTTFQNQVGGLKVVFVIVHGAIIHTPPIVYGEKMLAFLRRGDSQKNKYI